ncbi:helix-turn-helix transcriptional regulator [Psychrobacter sp. I-STPA6b]|uniref:helix-turn-helix transcriptional regulator n=1 Tax=Psychrobacter sp. I-STPA6b TaxID=2585718 RepID=UPI001D0CCDD1|nr:helix-turn-helix transcriptional regulator [Psychrobacter sp. I-STPA6b]
MTITPATPATLTLKSHHKIRIKKLTIRYDMLCLITAGTKHVFTNETQSSQYGTGSLLMFQQGRIVDIINEPLPSTPYQAIVLCLTTDYIKQFEQRQQSVLADMPILATYQQQPTAQIPLNQQLKETFFRAVNSIEAYQQDPHSLNPVIYHHRLDELLLMLASLGYQFQPKHALSISDKIFRVVGHQLHKQWSKTTIANALHISTSTLERRLKAENTSFRQLLLCFRMEQAMSLLLQGNLSVGEVAVACGYLSASRFSQAFQQYFSMLPSAVR